MTAVGEPTGWKNGGALYSLYNRLGGKAGIDAFTGILFDKLATDRKIGPRFAGGNPNNQRHNFALVFRTLTGANDD